MMDRCISMLNALVYLGGTNYTFESKHFTFLLITAIVIFFYKKTLRFIAMIQVLYFWKFVTIMQ